MLVCHGLPMFAFFWFSIATQWATQCKCAPVHCFVAAQSHWSCQSCCHPQEQQLAGDLQDRPALLFIYISLRRASLNLTFHITAVLNLCDAQLRQRVCTCLTCKEIPLSLDATPLRDALGQTFVCTCMRVSMPACVGDFSLASVCLWRVRVRVVWYRAVCGLVLVRTFAARIL